MSRYLVGIDLWTTNSVVYYIDKTTESSVPILLKNPTAFRTRRIEGRRYAVFICVHSG